jgi:hypothetical protein
MSSNSPAVFIALFSQPIVAEDFDVKIMNLKGRMMHMRDRAFKNKKGVVID